MKRVNKKNKKQFIPISGYKDNLKINGKILIMAISLSFFLLGSSGYCYALSAIKASVTIKVGDSESTALQIIKEAENKGGYFILHSDNHLKINIPAEKASDFLVYVEEKGIVTGKRYDAKDMSSELILKKTSLKAKENVLGQYIDVLEQSGKSKIIAVEREIIRLAGKIETLKGSIRFIEHNTSYAKIDVYFSLHDRRMPVASNDSSFEWLNTINLQDMIWDFQNEK